MTPAQGRVAAGWGTQMAAALAVGAATAVAVLLFKRAVQGAEWLSHRHRAPGWAELPDLWVLLVPVVGGVVVGVLLHLCAVPAEPKPGVSEVVRTVTLGDADFPERHTPAKAAAAALSLGAGAALGPEDPTVEIGAGIGRFATRRWEVDWRTVQLLVAAGATAGLSATFHAPLAAVLFALEVFTLRLRTRATAVVAVAALAAYGVISVLSPQVEPAVPRLAVESLWAVPAALVLGVVAGVLAAGQIRLVYAVGHAFFRWSAPPRWLKPALGGVVVGVVGLGLPELLGKGYDPLARILAGEPNPWQLLLLLAVGKLVLMAVSFGSGFQGGFFAPTLFAGAALGVGLGRWAAPLLREQGLVERGLTPEVLGVLGMAALLAGCVRAPLAATALLLELTRGALSLLPALLAASLAAWWISRALHRPSLYTHPIHHPESPPEPEPAPGSPHPDTRGSTGASE